MYSVLNTLSEYTFVYQKTLLHTLFCLFLKSLFKNLQCILKPLNITFRSSRSLIFLKIGVPKNFAIFIERHLCWSPLCLESFKFIKKRLQLEGFSEYIVKLLRTVFLIEHLRWLLLNLTLKISS